MKHLTTLLLALLVVGVLVQGAGAYTWEDHFTSDTSGSYTGTTGDLTWNTALGTGWLNDSAVTSGSEYFYSGEKFGSGSYTWQTNFKATAGMHYPIFIWGSVENTDTGNPYNTGTHYEVVFYDGAGVQLAKVVSGTLTSLGWPGVTQGTGLHNITVDWDSSTGAIKCYIDDSLMYNIVDTDITAPGYMGSGQTTFEVAEREYDFWRYWNSTSFSPPVADFSCTPLKGCTPQDVVCTETSTNTPTSWYWEMVNQTNGIKKTSTVKNPIFNISYGAGSTYNINMSASNAGGSDWENKTGYVDLNDCGGSAPNAMWVADAYGACVNQIITFTDASTNGPTSWNWSFGDGNVSALQNPTHAYAWQGGFLVNLTACNMFGCDIYLDKIKTWWCLGGAPFVPDTGDLPFPNQNEFDDVVFSNISQSDWQNTSVGNVVYPPIYEHQATIIPWEIWVGLIVAGSMMLLAAIVLPIADPKAVLAAMAFGCFGFDFVLSSLIGWIDLAWNAQALQIFGLNYTTFIIAQPVITIYAPPHMWGILLFLMLTSALVVLWGVLLGFKEATEVAGKGM